MKIEKLVKKFELYLKLSGGLSRQDVKVQDCTQCLLYGVCKPESVRKVFIKIEEEDKSIKIIGYGLDFGIRDYVEDENGKVTFRVLKACIEWLDPDPRIFK
jgi:hypothetical protein